MEEEVAYLSFYTALCADIVPALAQVAIEFE